MSRYFLRPSHLLTGSDLIAMGFAPGPFLKEIPAAVEDAQLGGELADEAAARAFLLDRFSPPDRRRAGP